MTTRRGLALGSVILIAGWACPAQQLPVPIEQLQPAPNQVATLDLPAAPLPADSTSASTLGESVASWSSVPGVASSSIVRTPPIRTRRTLSKSFFVVNALNLGLAGLDIAMTQQCMSNHRCHEGNPMMPSSLAGQLSMSFSIVGFDWYVSRRMSKLGSRTWWTPPVAGIVSHTIGFMSSMRNR